MKRNKPRQNIIKAFNAAIEGVIYTFKHERNMKIHYVIAVVVLLISLFLNLSRVEMMILLLSISLVIVSEMFNTAVENAVDLTTNEIHPLAKKTFHIFLCPSYHLMLHLYFFLKQYLYLQLNDDHKPQYLLLNLIQYLYYYEMLINLSYDLKNLPQFLQHLYHFHLNLFFS